MDANESEGSEVFFSAAESIRDVCTGSENSSPGRRYGTAGGARGSNTPELARDSYRDKEGTTRKPQRKKRHRHDSDTVKDSPLINHALTGMNTLYVLWANQKLCDVIVEIGNVSFPAHGVVLATHSDFFLRLLLKEQYGTAVSPRRMSLESLVTVAGFQQLLEYMYTSEIELTWDNVCEIMQAASALKVKRIAEIGQDFLQNYTVRNCLCAMYVAEQVNLTSFLAKVRSFVSENFVAVSRTETFLRCPAEMVVRLLADDNLSVPDEVEVLLAAKKWILSNGETGKKNARLVFDQVRLQHVTPEDLARHVYEDQRFLKIPGIKSTIKEKHTEGVTNASMEDVTLQCSPSWRKLERITRPAPSDGDNSPMTLLSTAAEIAKKAKILAQSTFLAQSSKSPCSFQPFGIQRPLKSDGVNKTDRGNQSAQRSTARESPQQINKHVTASEPKHITQMSPAPWPMPTLQDAAKETKTTEPIVSQTHKTPQCYRTSNLISDYRITASNPKSLISGPIAWPLMERLRRPDIIVTVGGVAKSGESETTGRKVEALLLDKNEWLELEPMPHARNHHVVLHLNNYLYVIGGSDPHAEGDDFLKPVSSVFKYDVCKGLWSDVQPMNAARIFHGAAALFGQLYVVGGQDQAGRTLATVECYSPNIDCWRYVAPLPSPRYGSAVTVYRNKMWVAGGFCDDDLSGSLPIPRHVVCYNPFRDQWDAMAPLRVPRCHASLLEMINRLFMIGGFVGESGDSEEKSQSDSTIETYNESLGMWELVGGIWQGRHDANTVTVDNKAYIVGGSDDDNEDPLPNVECFNAVSMAWDAGIAPLRSARFGHACCVVPGDIPVKLPQH